jgi:hypothetical protein
MEAATYLSETGEHAGNILNLERQVRWIDHRFRVYQMQLDSRSLQAMPQVTQ